jgi:hypothetical protein
VTKWSDLSIHSTRREFARFENPSMPRHGQLRRASLGWQWRISMVGVVFSPWMFTFTRRRALRKLGWFSPALVEEKEKP